MPATAESGVPLRHHVIAVLAAAWNLLGVTLFVVRIAMTPELAAQVGGAAAAAAEMPAWIDLAFGVAVVTGLSGAIALLVRRRWAAPMLLVSLGAAAVQATAVPAVLAMRDALHASALAVPVALLLVALALWSYARSVRTRGWLR
ncbi:sugar transporter [Luteimonas suaedae]|uniref:sugar transporter n=1 Tax=Luteimonas suaedae TaxID=2605430 RepID=UPI0011ED119E|nr:sugar transporter [Luteimonas suaedae]